MGFTEWFAYTIIAVGLIMIGMVVGQIIMQPEADSAPPQLPSLPPQLPLSPRQSESTTYEVIWPFGELSFEEVFSGDSAIEQPLTKQLKDHLDRYFWAHGIAQMGNIIVQSIQFSMQKKEFIVVFSPEGQRLLGIGMLKMMGGRLPMLVDAKTGQIVEIGRIISSSMGRFIGPMWSLIISVSHIISTADLINRINKLDRKVDWLIEMRSVDQFATIERIFYAAREVCSQPIDEHAKNKLWGMAQELRQLRIALRNECKVKIDQIPTETTLKDMIPILGKREKQHKIQQFEAAQREIIARLYTIEMILRMELVLAVARREETIFFRSLVKELNSIESMLQRLDDKGVVLLQPSQAQMWYEVVQSYRRLADEPFLKEMPQLTGAVIDHAKP